MSVEPTAATTSKVTLFDRTDSQLQNSLFQHSHHVELCIFTSNEQELRAALMTVSTTASLCPQPLFALCKCSAGVTERQWAPFCPHGGIQWHPFVPYALPPFWSCTILSDWSLKSRCSLRKSVSVVRKRLSVWIRQCCAKGNQLE